MEAPGRIPIRSVLEAEARRQLADVGDPALGEWVDWTGRALHLRRRLSTPEQQRAGGLIVVDIRRTPEAARRARALGDRLQYAPSEVLADEIGSDYP